mmetsp:Transcript_47451/g.107578  ORF Transcript_47451/g.107578 Transcript_47451/m.107578 type:complete len:207 (-) Transcript_47451:535-1155(-)
MYYPVLRGRGVLPGGGLGGLRARGGDLPQPCARCPPRLPRHVRTRTKPWTVGGERGDLPASSAGTRGERGHHHQLGCQLRRQRILPQRDSRSRPAGHLRGARVPLFRWGSLAHGGAPRDQRALPRGDRGPLPPPRRRHGPRTAARRARRRRTGQAGDSTGRSRFGGGAGGRRKCVGADRHHLGTPPDQTRRRCLISGLTAGHLALS